jgi:hypothetical protein
VPIPADLRDGSDSVSSGAPLPNWLTGAARAGAVRAEPPYGLVPAEEKQIVT